MPENKFTVWSFRGAVIAFIFVIVHIAVSVGVLRFFAENHIVAIFWPASGLALAAVLLGGLRYVPLVFFAAAVANSIASGFSWPAVAFGICNMLETVAGYWLLRRLSPIDPGLSRARDYFRLFVFGGIVAPLSSAVGGACVIYGAGLSQQNWLHNFQYWWMGNSLGILLITPMILIWRGVPRNGLSKAQVAEAAVALPLAFITGQIIFVGWLPDAIGPHARAFLMFAFVTWAAIRFGRHATLLVIMMVILQILAGKMNHHSFFAGTSNQIELVNIWLYVAMISVIGMLLATFVHERKMSLGALAATATRLEQVSIFAGIGGWELDLRTKLMHLSPEVRRIIQYDNPKPLPFDEAVVFLQPEYRAVHRARFDLAASQGIPWDTELGMLTARGEKIWVRSKGVAQSENNQIVKLIGIVHDITNLRRSDDALRQSEDRFRNLVESSGEAIFVHQSGFLVYANPACIKIMGATHIDQLRGMNVLDIPTPEYRDIVVDRIKKVHRDGETVPVMEMKFRRFDGGCVDVEVAGSATVYNGQVATLVVARDITARKIAEASLRLSEQRFRQIFSTLSEGVVLSELVRDAEGEIIDHRVIQVNDAYYRVADYNKNIPVIGALGSQLYSVSAEASKAYFRSLKEATQTTHVEMFSEISKKYFQVSTSPVVNDQYVTTFHDITERKESEIALREGSNKLRSLFAAMTDVILVLDSAGKYIEIAATNSALLYRPPDQLLGMTIHEIFPAAQADYFVQNIKLTLDSNQTVAIHYSLDIQGEEIWFEAKLSKLTEDSVVLVARDITESKRAEEKIRYLGQHDILTGLPNRALFEDRLARTIVLAQTHSSTFALLFLDVDHFKKINDSMGHQFGDLFLKEVARRLSASVKNIDTVSRQGGDEFIILLHEQAHPEDAAIVAQNICTAIAEPFAIEQAVVHASISIGIAVYPRDGTTRDKLLKNSDIAMYHAKESGRNQFQYFSEELNRVTHERLEIEAALRQAAARGELEVHYQPQLNFHTGKIESCEALIRWNHPQWGSVSPARFIPIAEESGQIFELGAWVLADVGRRFRDLRASGFGELRLSVNVSAVQIQHPQFCELVQTIVRENNIPARHLELEVTESMLMQDTQKSVTTMRQLSGIGVKFSIDDFGTGYSSLSYLRQLKIDYLKIDQSFVRDLMHDADDAAIVRAIIGLAHNLRLQVIAEGVETPEQRDYLRSQGCDLMQGFLLARPMSFADLLKFLQS